MSTDLIGLLLIILLNKSVLHKDIGLHIEPKGLNNNNIKQHPFVVREMAYTEIVAFVWTYDFNVSSE